MKTYNIISKSDKSILMTVHGSENDARTFQALRFDERNTEVVESKFESINDLILERQFDNYYFLHTNFDNQTFIKVELDKVEIIDEEDMTVIGELDMGLFTAIPTVHKAGMCEVCQNRGIYKTAVYGNWSISDHALEQCDCAGVDKLIQQVINEN